MAALSIAAEVPSLVSVRLLASVGSVAGRDGEAGGAIIMGTGAEEVSSIGPLASDFDCACALRSRKVFVACVSLCTSSSVVAAAVNVVENACGSVARPNFALAEGMLLVASCFDWMAAITCE
jgi:hypothetical protein